MHITLRSFKSESAGFETVRRRSWAVLLGVTVLTGCMSIPKDIFLLPANYLETREKEIQKYETTDEKKIVTAAAAVLQDLGFTLDKSETQLGLLVASKDRSATSAGQVTAALVLDVLAAAAGTYSNAYAQTDKAQQISASMVILPSMDEKSTSVRVKFQRVVWNRMNQVSRLEHLKEPALYQEFFDKLSKGVFLEEQKA